MRARRTSRRGLGLGYAVFAVAAATLSLAACQTTTGSQSPGQVQVGGASPKASGPLPALVVSSVVPYDAAVSIGVRHGTLESVTVTQSGGPVMAGKVTGNGAAWVSTGLPRPGTRYVVAASATSTAGQTTSLAGSFAVAAVPTSRRLTLTVSPGTGSVVGVGAPVIIRFDQSVVNRAAVERSLVVSSSTPVTGAWHWFGDREVHFRPENYWPADSTVDVKLKMGTMGYCMSGPFALRTAAARPERIGAVATFHGGGLVTKNPDSPHLLISQTKARYLVAIAASDDKNDPDAKVVLRESFDHAHLDAEVEVYEGTQHGWCPPDAVVYNHDQAEKAWGRLLVLLHKALA